MEELNNIARITGKAIQDDEAFKSEGGFVPERDQFYFELKQNNNTFLLGFKDILNCLRLLEKMDEIPKIGEKWWRQLATLYGEDILMIDFNINKQEEVANHERNKIHHTI